MASEARSSRLRPKPLRGDLAATWVGPWTRLPFLGSLLVEIALEAHHEGVALPTATIHLLLSLDAFRCQFDFVLRSNGSRRGRGSGDQRGQQHQDEDDDGDRHDDP